MILKSVSIHRSPDSIEVRFSDYAAANAVHRFSLGFPLILEIGFGVGEVAFGPRQDTEEGASGDFFEGPLVVILVIGHEEEFAVGREDFGDGEQEIVLDEAAAMMADLGPWIGAEQVEAGDGGFG